MGIFKTEDKENLLDAMKNIETAFPIFESEDPDFSAALLHRMAKIVSRHGYKHGVKCQINDGYNFHLAMLDEVHTWPRRNPFLIGGGGGGTGSNGIRKIDKCPSEKDIDRIIFNHPATIIVWKDGTKTVVKCQDEDLGYFTPEAGIAIAIMKKIFGNKGNFNNILRRLVKGAIIQN